MMNDDDEMFSHTEHDYISSSVLSKVMWNVNQQCFAFQKTVNSSHKIWTGQQNECWSSQPTCPGAGENHFWRPKWHASCSAVSRTSCSHQSSTAYEVLNIFRQSTVTNCVKFLQNFIRCIVPWRQQCSLQTAGWCSVQEFPLHQRWGPEVSVRGKVVEHSRRCSSVHQAECGRGFGNWELPSQRGCSVCPYDCSGGAAQRLLARWEVNKWSSK